MPQDTSDEHTKYRFFPTVRRGYLPSDEFPKSDLSGNDNELRVGGQATVNYTAEVTEGPDDGDTARDSVDLSMYGPGHVTGIDSSQVVRMEPEPGSSTTPPNYFPFVEFETPDLPWLFSPVTADDEGRSFPWLRLVAIEKKSASLSQAAEGPNPVLEAPESALPPAEDAWAWAHAQVTGDPGQEYDAGDAFEAAFTSRSDSAVSRVICPTNLDPSTSYMAAVVPTFEAGRTVGLGQEPPAQGNGQGSGMKLAWPASDNAGDGTLKLPVYHHWEFATTEKGDFEYLVRKLEPRDLSGDDYTIGYREFDVTDPGPENLDFDDGKTHTARIGGALRATRCDDWWWYEHSEELRRLLNKPATALGETGGYEIIGPPVYGKWHSQEIFETQHPGAGFQDLRPDSSFDDSVLTPPSEIEWCDENSTAATVENEFDGYGPLKPLLGDPLDPYGKHGNEDLQWLYDLNLTPGFRIPASVGGEIVQDKQENLMQSAWEQVGEVREANRRLAAAQLSRGAMVNSVERLTDTAYPDEKLLQLTEPAHERMYLDDRGTTVANHLEASSVTTAVFSPACRRLLSPAGQLASRVDAAADASADVEGVASALASGELEVSIDHGPGGMVVAGEAPGDLDELCRDAREQLGPRDRDEDTSEEETQQRRPPADSAVTQLKTMRADARHVLDTLGQMRRVLSVDDPTSKSVSEVRRLANDAVGAWHSLDSTVASFRTVIATMSARRESLPSVSDDFDETTRINLYGDLSGTSKIHGDMTQPFREPFLPSVSNTVIWPGGLRTFSGQAQRRALALQRLSYEQGWQVDAGTDVATGESESAGDAGDGDDEDAGPTYPVTVGEVRSAEESAQSVLTATKAVLGYLGEGGADTAYLTRLFCGRSFTPGEAEVVVDPESVRTSWSPIESLEERVLERLGTPVLAEREDPLDTIMAYPEFPQPMYRDLKEVSEDYILPGVDQVPNDTVGALETNTRFIEAYMVGLNYEMGSELLWRNYPADRRGSYFKRFWDQRSRIPKPDEEKLDDIIPVHRWDDKGPNNRARSPLGSNVRTGETNDDIPPDEQAGDSGGNVTSTVVLLVRGELLRRYPNTTIYAAKAKNDGGDRVPTWASAEDKASEKDDSKQKFPIFRGKLDPDITFLGFDLGVDEAVDAPYHKSDTEDPDDRPDEGWFFVLSEPPGETKFGMDIGQEGETEAPIGVSKGLGNAPKRKASEEDLEGAVEPGWSGLSWKQLPTGDGDDVAHIKVDQHKPGKQDWAVEAGDRWATPEAWLTESEEADRSDVDQTGEDRPETDDPSEFEFTEEEAAVWGKNSAHMAFITWQKPVRIAIHADDIIPGGDN